MLTCEQCQSKLVAYLHRELDPLERRQVARHLDTCETCYALYLQEYELAQNLGEIVPLIGQGRQPRFDRMWSAIQQDIAHPRRAVKRYPAHFGLAALAVTIMLLIPLVLGKQSLPLRPPATQPSPIVMRATPSSTETAIEPLGLQSSLTPEAKSILITGPSPDAITTP